ncbi:TPA: hypothetical protein K8N36_002990 [Clostridium perfringens]|uniref:hypothetical protein n=1 Tax=Clostridium perfringens TaxID=1502 RepID=UPI001CB203D1|nr:hypothetical protein [Clostridium perfringens]HBI6884205.1 hypothetical protein [Clostridium perfringens]HBI6902023.1 hypothetical protein [Clostridium perfringens]HBI6931002.1 hypothetical protein [Clostridium perfringens]HBI6941163.1 hypothetical protein [Clostridium perfringens]
MSTKEFKIMNKQELKAICESKMYSERNVQDKIREYIDAEDEAKQVFAKLENGEKLQENERLALLYGFTLNSDLINKCTNTNVNYGTVYVKGINEKGEYTTLRKESLSSNNGDRILVEDIPRREVIECGKDFVSKSIEGDVRVKILKHLIKVLDSSVLEVSKTDNRAEDLVRSIDKLGEKHKNFTITLNTKDYINLSNHINDLSKFDIVIDDNIKNMYVGNLKVVIINYVLGKIGYGLNAKGGSYDVACNIYNLSGCIADETGICKIV